MGVFHRLLLFYPQYKGSLIVTNKFRSSKLWMVKISSKPSDSEGNSNASWCGFLAAAE